MNFALVSANATGVTLVLFTEADLHAGRSSHEIPLQLAANRTGAVWHLALPALDSSLLYGEHSQPAPAHTEPGVKLGGRSHTMSNSSVFPPRPKRCI